MRKIPLTTQRQKQAARKPLMPVYSPTTHGQMEGKTTYLIDIVDPIDVFPNSLRVKNLSRIRKTILKIRNSRQKVWLFSGDAEVKGRTHRVMMYLPIEVTATRIPGVVTLMRSKASFGDNVSSSIEEFKVQEVGEDQILLPKLPGRRPLYVNVRDNVDHAKFANDALEKVRQLKEITEKLQD